MPFETLSIRLQEVATRSLSFCRTRYGNTGVRVDEGIDDAIRWRPSFFLKAAKTRIIAVEVEDNLYPNSLQGAAHEISHYDFPISVYQACSLEAYQNDPKHKNVNLLKKFGFGIITVDEDGNAVIQHPCVPLAQHISADILEKEVKGLTPAVKVSFRSAHATYYTNEGQGLQEAGQIIEGIIRCIVSQAVKKGVIGTSPPNKPLADVIDDLYATNQFRNHRAALGGARSFVREYRNVVSHPAKTAKQAAEKIRKCKAGFLEAIGIAVKLRSVAQAMGYQIKIFVA